MLGRIGYCLVLVLGFANIYGAECELPKPDVSDLPEDIVDRYCDKVFENPLLKEVCALIRDNTAKSNGALTKMLRENPEVVSMKGGHYGVTPLHVATDAGNLKAVRMLVEMGAPVNARTNTGYLALHGAIIRCRRFRQDKKIVQFLIQNGADVLAESIDGDLIEMARFGRRTKWISWFKSVMKRARNRQNASQEKKI